jgi:head-tail adaptor
MPGLPAGEMDRLIRIERPIADNSLDGAGSGSWEKVAEDVWCSIQDALPSRGEKLAGGINIATRPARVRMYFRDDLTSAMRFIETTDGADGRVMQIVSGPATIGRRDGLEFMVEDYSLAGNAA